MTITKSVKIIDKKKFGRAALDKYSKTFVIYVAAFEGPEMTSNLSKTAQVIDDSLIQVSAL